MDLSEFEPQEIRESGEGSEKPEEQELNDATFEPLSVTEQTGNYQQAEAIQGYFTALTDAFANIPIPAEVTGILMGVEPPGPGEGEKGGMPPPPDAGLGLKSPKEDPNATGPSGTGASDMPPEKPPGSGADDIPPEKAMGSGADDMPSEKALGSGADDMPIKKAAGTGVDRSEPIDEPGTKEEQAMKYERDSDPSDRRKRD